MDSLRTACAAIAILLLATSCIERLAGERRPHPRVVPDRSVADGSAPGDSVTGRVAGGRTEGAASIAFLRELRAGGALPSGRLRGPYGPGEYGDAWERVRLLMTMVPVRSEVSSLREFRRKLHRYHGNQRFFDALGDNARPWLYHVTRQLAARGVPGEIALLPAVESGYDARAVSSRKAAGLWQILPGTARDLKLTRSWWYDARHDAPAATDAALDYLISLHELFDGDWMLAVAAYNCGPGNVRRAIRRAGLRIETAEYATIERYLPRETRSHMARWLVFSEIVAMPRLHNVWLEAIPWRPYFTEVSASTQIDLATTARHAGLRPAELAVLNLGIRRGVTAPNGPHRLLVPAEHASRVGRALSEVRPVQVAEVRRYRVRKGDTLSVIAEAHGTTVKALMSANRLNSHLIRAGRDLMIPVSGVASSAPDASEGAVHVVSPGESLWLIARLYRTTVSSLRDWNRLAPGSNLLHPGQELRVRSKG